jgi:hypothetical protein
MSTLTREGTKIHWTYLTTWRSSISPTDGASSCEKLAPLLTEIGILRYHSAT